VYVIRENQQVGETAADALATVNERSVCRNYRPDPAPDDRFRLLCATALAAPTKSDLQQADIVRPKGFRLD
jgi:nitroreductase/FMN reductase [NAD(P)H]